MTLRRGGRTPAQAALPPLSAEETNLVAQPVPIGAGTSETRQTSVLPSYRLSGEGRNPAFPGAYLDTGFRRYDIEASALAALSAEETNLVAQPVPVGGAAETLLWVRASAPVIPDLIRNPVGEPVEHGYRLPPV